MPLQVSAPALAATVFARHALRNGENGGNGHKAPGQHKHAEQHVEEGRVGIEPAKSRAVVGPGRSGRVQLSAKNRGQGIVGGL